MRLPRSVGVSRLSAAMSQNRRGTRPPSPEKEKVPKKRGKMRVSETRLGECSCAADVQLVVHFRFSVRQKGAALKMNFLCAISPWLF